jgi:NADH-quinone oxidoreductase subunit G
VLRVLANLLQVDGFEYASTDDIRSEIGSFHLETPIADNFQSNQLPTSFEIPASNELQRITEMPIYAVDAMVRRAGALQKTTDAQKSTGIVLNAQQFAHYQGNEKVQVSQNGQTFELTFRLEEAVPQNCALMFGGQMLGNWDGFLTVGES